MHACSDDVHCIFFAPFPPAICPAISCKPPTPPIMPCKPRPPCTYYLPTLFRVALSRSGKKAGAGRKHALTDLETRNPESTAYCIAVHCDPWPFQNHTATLARNAVDVPSSEPRLKVLTLQAVFLVPEATRTIGRRGRRKRNRCEMAADQREVAIHVSFARENAVSNPTAMLPALERP